MATKRKLCVVFKAKIIAEKKSADVEVVVPVAMAYEPMLLSPLDCSFVVNGVRYYQAKQVSADLNTDTVSAELTGTVNPDQAIALITFFKDTLTSCKVADEEKDASAAIEALKSKYSALLKKSTDKREKPAAASGKEKAQEPAKNRRQPKKQEEKVDTKIAKGDKESDLTDKKEKAKAKDKQEAESSDKIEVGDTVILEGDGSTVYQVIAISTKGTKAKIVEFNGDPDAHQTVPVNDLEAVTPVEGADDEDEDEDFEDDFEEEEDTDSDDVDADAEEGEYDDDEAPFDASDDFEDEEEFDEEDIDEEDFEDEDFD
jgi:hypothetical protein